MKIMPSLGLSLLLLMMGCASSESVASRDAQSDQALGIQASVSSADSEDEVLEVTRNQRIQEAQRNLQKQVAENISQSPV